MSSSEAARELGVTDRQVRHAVTAGHIQAEQVAGRLILYQKQVFAYKRALTKGRQWSTVTRLAALDLLNGSDTSRIRGSQKSRLKSRLRDMAPGALVWQILTGSTSLFDPTENVDLPSYLVGELDLVGTRTRVLVAHNSRREAAKQKFRSNPNGSIVAIEGEQDHRRVLEVLALYMFGDTREHTAARDWLTTQKTSIR